MFVLLLAAVTGQLFASAELCHSVIENVSVCQTDSETFVATSGTASNPQLGVFSSHITDDAC